MIAGPYSMDQHADDLAALLDHLLVQKAVIAGLSMGGYVALAFWRRHPQRVAGLALVDTRANADTPDGRAGRTATADRVRERGVTVLAEEMMPRLLSPENLGDEQIAGRCAGDHPPPAGRGDDRRIGRHARPRG